MNIDMKGLLQVINKYTLTSDESMKKYIESINYTQNKKNLLYILLRKLKHPKLIDLFYENAIRDKFINTLNETLFQYTPNILKNYFNSYYGRVRKYTNYISNDSDLYGIFDSIYECIFERDKEKEYINTDSNLKINMKEESLFRNILEEPAFFNLDNINYLCDFKYKKLNGDFKYNMLCSLKEHVKELAFQKTQKVELEIEYTDEFLDPIMKVEIKEPVILPKSNNVMDKHILEEMLLYNNLNPFTQEELYMGDVLKYNETQDAQELIQDFLKRKKQFKEEYIYKL